MHKRVDREDKSLLIGKRNKDVFSQELYMTWAPSFKDLYQTGLRSLPYALGHYRVICF